MGRGARALSRLLTAFAVWLALGPALAFAACDLPVARQGPPPLLTLAAAARLAQVPSGHVSLTFVGHATFLIETPSGVTIATDYNDYVRPRRAPLIATMNRAHDTHYTLNPDPAIRHVLHGWAEGGGMALHDVIAGDVRVRNVPTNIREFGGTSVNGNSIFVFESAGLCIAHLGHLHHTLDEVHLKELGKIDVVLAPIDGAFTMGQELIAEVLEQIKAPLQIPMHYFNIGVLERFVRRVGSRYEVRTADSATVLLSRAMLPQRPTLLILPGT